MVFLLNEAFTKIGADWEVIVIDDNSPDKTLQVAEKLQEIYGADKVVLKPRKAKLGLGTAYVHGLKYARGDFIFIMDSDLSHHPKFIPSFIEKQLATDCDVVTGSRYISGGGVFGWNLKRKTISVGANHLAATLLQTGVSDLTGSFRLFKKPVLESLMKQVTSKVGLDAPAPPPLIAIPITAPVPMPLQAPFPLDRLSPSLVGALVLMQRKMLPCFLSLSLSLSLSGIRVPNGGDGEGPPERVRHRGGAHRVRGQSLRRVQARRRRDCVLHQRPSLALLHNVSERKREEEA